MGTKNYKATVGLVDRDQHMTIPEHRRLSAALGDTQLGTYGIRNTSEATLALSEDIVGVVFVSRQTDHEVEIVGRVDGAEKKAERVAKEYRKRNGAPKVPSRRPKSGRFTPIQARTAGTRAATSLDETPITQKESELLERYQAFLGDSRPLTYTSLRHPGSTQRLVIDAYDASRHALIEAKASAGRDSVRLAIGQLLDYRRGIRRTKELIILLPTWPERDLIELAHELTMVVCAEQEDHTFARSDGA